MRDTLLGKRGRTALIMLGMLAGTIVVLIVYAVVVAATNTKDIRDTQLEGTPTGKKLVKSADRILDCTEPGGKCFQQSQRRTAAAVGDIGRYVVLAAACSADVSPDMAVADRIEAITDCVTERLSR